MSPDPSIEEPRISSTQDSQAAKEPDGIEGTQKIYEGVFRPFPRIHLQILEGKKRKR